MGSSAIPVVETARLVLRGFGPEDFGEFCAMRADPEVMHYIGTEGPQTRDQSEGWLDRNARRWRDEGFGMWAVTERAGGELLGWCGLSRLEDTQEVELGYGLARRAWGRGFATESARASLRYGFERAGLARIVAVAVPENTASRRVMEKLGMKYEKTEPHYGIDCVFYAVAREDFTPRASVYALHEGPLSGES